MSATEQHAAPLILVADDVPANVELLFDQLSTLGYRTLSADDGPSALAACFEHNPDLCILDVSMPAGDLGVDTRSTGFEVCRRIKRDPRTSRIPVLDEGRLFGRAAPRAKASSRKKPAPSARRRREVPMPCSPSA